MSADIVQRALAKIDEYYEAIENGTVTEDLLVELGDLERAMTDEQRYDFYVGIGAINDDVFEAHPELRGAGKATIVAHVTGVFTEATRNIDPHIKENTEAARTFREYENNPLRLPLSSLKN